jgi:hypothetical protein
MKKTLRGVVALCGLGLLNACGGSVAAPPPPTVSISASSSTVTVGQSLTLTWSSTNATSCIASASPSESDWSGPEPTGGSQSVTPASAETITYTLQCSGAGGNASRAAPVAASVGALTITSPAPPTGVVGQVYHPIFCIPGSPGCHCVGYICYKGHGFPLFANGGLAPTRGAGRPHRDRPCRRT